MGGVELMMPATLESTNFSPQVIKKKGNAPCKTPWIQEMAENLCR